jgi:uncharacterized membrane protein
MQMSPIIAVHMTAAIAAVVTGPVALWARRAGSPHPRLHRAFGYVWVTLMIATAVSAVFIRDHRLPNIDGFTPIHLLVPITLASLFFAFWKLGHRDFAGHRRVMLRLYFAACIATGFFTLLPQRYLGQLLWTQLGLI